LYVFVLPQHAPNLLFIKKQHKDGTLFFFAYFMKQQSNQIMLIQR